MFYLSGLLLLLLDPSMICGQMTQDNRTAFEDINREKIEICQNHLLLTYSSEKTIAISKEACFHHKIKKILLRFAKIPKSAIKHESIRVKNESVQQELDKFFSTERPNIMHEDSVNFQTQDFQIRYSHCHEESLMYYGGHCWEIFNDSMSKLGKENWCNMEMVIRNYHKLTECIEFVCSVLECFYPNHVVEQLFVRIHQQYFSPCNNEDDLPDAPAGVVLVSTLLPILLIPFIVYIVVWKSSLRD